jgi:hypothetical protein
MVVHPHSGNNTRDVSAARKISCEVFCVHCFRSLGALRDATQRRRVEAKHVCQEKWLARQPDAPTPFN